MATKKQKILLIGFAEWDQKIIPHVKQLQSLIEKFEIICAFSLIDALYEISEAKCQKNPIRGLVFKRDGLEVIKGGGCAALVLQFAKKCSERGVLDISMIHDDQDDNSKKNAISGNYCKVDDWKRMETLFDMLL